MTIVTFLVELHIANGQQTTSSHKVALFVHFEVLMELNFNLIFSINLCSPESTRAAIHASALRFKLQRNMLPCLMICFGLACHAADDYVLFVMTSSSSSFSVEIHQKIAGN